MLALSVVARVLLFEHCFTRLSEFLRMFPSWLQLTLTYNRTRQASITTELIEIIRLASFCQQSDRGISQKNIIGALKNITN